ncbi:hypothetical protein [Henriciella algicola]|uniref:Uncharacterized protein n=1 Tax=Henriciella algicola TaxID=1608422 RepID=A0A399RMH2_9PROT|nr:hypothetical protein [Henriciella algicola]RIJ31059.1 hypothetical protein D1222_01970 [Henriciella algicola]
MGKTDLQSAINKAQKERQAEKKKPSFSIDFDKYLPYLEDSEIPESEKLQLIETLYAIMRSLVDIGFDIHPIGDGCGQVSKAARKFTPDSGNSVKSEADTLAPRFGEEARALETADDAR